MRRPPDVETDEVIWTAAEKELAMAAAVAHDRRVERRKVYWMALKRFSQILTALILLKSFFGGWWAIFLTFLGSKR